MFAPEHRHTLIMSSVLALLIMTVMFYPSHRVSEFCHIQMMLWILGDWQQNMQRIIFTATSCACLDIQADRWNIRILMFGTYLVLILCPFLQWGYMRWYSTVLQWRAAVSFSEISLFSVSHVRHNSYTAALPNLDIADSVICGAISSRPCQTLMSLCLH